MYFHKNMSKHKMLWMLTKMYQKKKGRCFTFIFHLPAKQPYIQDFFLFDACAKII